ncbi:MAG: amidohydrolase [Verrucomicrobiales bacterium]|nr:amidohydrolase [Verrucomicrobiales bacterium]|tara:strand:+ start:14428 stop:15258 length:831 start_codon:yes stop_codon:yes gene_type:complete
MKIDSHQHFWNYDAVDYSWISEELAVLKRNFTPADLKEELGSVGIDCCVAVQARQTVEEGRWLCSLADDNDFIKGVVGWVDLCSEDADRQMEKLNAHPRFVGVRHVVQDEEDDRFIVGENFMRGISLLEKYELRYDILIFPKQLPATLEFVKQFPDQPFVLDHIAKPLIKDAIIEPWELHIRELARFSNVMCKVSGMVTEADWKGWEVEHFDPFLDVVLDAFGPDRLMYGSDWPVCTLAGSYKQAHSLALRLAEQLSESEQEKFWGGNAAKFYGLE